MPNNTSTDTAPNTGLLTLWFSCNYGAVLTTFALYRVLESMGQRPLLLDPSPMSGNPLFAKEDNISRSFLRRHGLRCTAPLHTDREIEALNDSLDTFIVGSDQVWRHAYSPYLGLLNYLDFVRGDKRKIAVSSSFGLDHDERPAPSLRRAAFCLQAFDAVSVREHSGLRILQESYGITGEQIPDPVFLCDTACYEELTADLPLPEKPYLLSYVLEPTPTIRRCIETVAAQHGLEIINMVDAQQDLQALKAKLGLEQVVANLSTEQWLSYIRHCSYLVTDSFHGVCFAHLFKRPFLCMALPQRGLTRLQSLLQTTGLSHRLLPPDAADEALAIAETPIDWASIHATLHAERERGRRWLEQALHQARTPLLEHMGRLVYEEIYRGNGEQERRAQTQALAAEIVSEHCGARLQARLRRRLFFLKLRRKLSRGQTKEALTQQIAALRSAASYLSRHGARLS